VNDVFVFEVSVVTRLSSRERRRALFLHDDWCRLVRTVLGRYVKRHLSNHWTHWHRSSTVLWCSIRPKASAHCLTGQDDVAQWHNADRCRHVNVNVNLMRVM